MINFTTPETVDLGDPDRILTDTENSDVIHRADYPRMAVRDELGEAMCGVMTRGATDIADARCGVPPDHDGAHPNRGTLRWYRHYLARLDEFADELVPGWRSLPHPTYTWTDRYKELMRLVTSADAGQEVLRRQLERTPGNLVAAG